MPPIELIRGHSFTGGPEGGPERYGHGSSCATGIRDPGPGIRRGRGTHGACPDQAGPDSGLRTPDSGLWTPDRGSRTPDPGPRIPTTIK